MSGTSNMGMILLSAEEREKNTFEGNKTVFPATLNEDAWREFLSEFNRDVDGKPVLMGTGLEEKSRGELLSKMVELRKASWKTTEDECKALL